MSLSLLFAALVEAAAQGTAAAPATKPAEAIAPAVIPAPPAPKLSFKEFHINTNAIAMTFDDGPHAKNTPRLLDMLKERGIKATFFLIGKSISAHPEILRRMIAEGHEVANHTWDHKSLRTLSEKGINDELQKTHDAIMAACGVAPRVYRPPFGAITTKQMKAVNDLFKYTSILWDVDTNDWKSPRTVAKVHDTILKEAHPGAIILCHDIHEPTIDAMPTTLDELKAKGFQFLTISEMIKLEEDEIKGVKPPAATAPVTTAPPTPAPTPAAPVEKPKTSPAIGTTIPIEVKQPPPAKP
jgi:peptidoglycan/xylan/chitin deacetylase (PgdA/CDA1 family)